MEFDWIWKSILIILVGTFLLRIAGRKSISQMTLPQTVIMIGIGSLLIQPVSGKNIWITFGVGLILVATLIVMELAQIKGNIVEKILTGKSKILIENGTINEKNLKKVRLTVDQLEMNLREKNVMNIHDVEWATLEPNGKMGFMLKEDAQPVTKKEFNQLANQINRALDTLASRTNLYQMDQLKNQENLFKEVADKEHQTPTPRHLQ